eukprot:SAG31_NODE_219_length_19926_cov_4.297297_12_plen_967_part_00
MQIDLGKLESVSGAVIQRRKDIPAQFIKKYKVHYSADGTSWEALAGGSEQTCDWNGRDDADEKSYTEFEEVVTARYIRLEPLTWNLHISMRAAVVVQRADGQPACTEAARGTPMSIEAVDSITGLLFMDKKWYSPIELKLAAPSSKGTENRPAQVAAGLCIDDIEHPSFCVATASDPDSSDDMLCGTADCAETDSARRLAMPPGESIPRSVCSPAVADRALSWTLTTKPAGGRFIVGAVPALAAAEATDNPFGILDEELAELADDWPVSGWAVSVGKFGLVGWSHFPAISLQPGESVRAIALPTRQLVISRLKKDGTTQVLLEAGLGNGPPLRLAAMAFAGCTLQLEPPAGRAKPAAYRLTGATDGPATRLLDAINICLRYLDLPVAPVEPPDNRDSSEATLVTSTSSLAAGLGLPILTDLVDGTSVHHSSAILAYLGRKHGLWPTTLAEAAHADSLLLRINIVWEALLGTPNSVSSHQLIAKSAPPNFDAASWSGALAFLEAAIAEGPTGDFAVSGGLSAADFALHSLTTFLFLVDPALLASCRHLGRHHRHMRLLLSTTGETERSSRFSEQLQNIFVRPKASVSCVEVLSAADVVADPSCLGDLHADVDSAATMVFGIAERSWRCAVCTEEQEAAATCFRLSTLLRENGPAWPSSFSAYEGEQLLADGLYSAAVSCLETAFLFTNQNGSPADVLDRRRCLLAARTAKLLLAQRAKEPLGGCRSKTQAVNAALLCDPKFDGVEMEAWNAAFGTNAMATVAEAILALLDSTDRRITEIETEKASVLTMETTTGLDRSDSGAFRRPVRSADDADGDAPTPEQVSEDISEARVRHMLQPPARVARQGLGSLVDGTVSFASRTDLLVSSDVLNLCAYPSQKRNWPGPPQCMLLNVVKQTDNDACGHHALHNAITVARALMAKGHCDGVAWLADLRSVSEFEARKKQTIELLKKENNRRHVRSHALLAQA